MCLTIGTTPAATGSFGDTARFATLSGGLARAGLGSGDGRAGRFWSQHSVLVLIDQARSHVIGATAAYRDVSELLIRRKRGKLDSNLPGAVRRSGSGRGRGSSSRSTLFATRAGRVACYTSPKRRGTNDLQILGVSIPSLSNSIDLRSHFWERILIRNVSWLLKTLKLWYKY